MFSRKWNPRRGFLSSKLAYSVPRVKRGLITGTFPTTQEANQLTPALMTIELGLFNKALTKRIEEDPSFLKNPQEPVRIVDYGTGDGRTAAVVLKDFVKSLQDASPDHEVKIEFLASDRDKNNWVKFRNNLSAVSEEFPNLSIQEIPKTFRGTVVSENTVDFGFSFDTIQWLSGVPMPVEDLVYLRPLENQRYDEATIKLWDQKSKDDLNTFFSARKQELKPEGRLIISAPCLANPPADTDWRAVEIVSGTFKRLKSALEEIPETREQGFKQFALPVMVRTPEKYNISAREHLAIEKTLTYDIEFKHLRDLLDHGHMEEYAEQSIELIHSTLRGPYISLLKESGLFREERRRGEVVDQMISSALSHFQSISADDAFYSSKHFSTLLKRAH